MPYTRNELEWRQRLGALPDRAFARLLTSRGMTDPPAWPGRFSWRPRLTQEPAAPRVFFTRGQAPHQWASAAVRPMLEGLVRVVLVVDVWDVTEGEPGEVLSVVVEDTDTVEVMSYLRPGDLEEVDPRLLLTVPQPKRYVPTGL